MQRFFICDQNALSPGGHYLEYTRCIAGKAAQRGFTVYVFCNKRFEFCGESIDRVEFRPVYTRTWGESEALPAQSGGDEMVFETEMALLHFGAKPTDHVLLHTIGMKELMSWLDYFAGLPRYRFRELPRFHLIARFDPEPLMVNDSIELRTLEKKLHEKRNQISDFVHLACDTHLLAERYTALLGLPFSVLPIPFTHKIRPPRSSHKKGRVVTITYLGDARLEKGFAQFPTLVASLWDSHIKPKKVRFVFQANTNIPGGEGNISDAVRALSQYPASMIEVITEPMSGVEYSERLNESDIILLPYDAARYRWRSSGILIEALAMGKPVVVTGGTWMETQVGKRAAEFIETPGDLPRAVIRLVDRLASATAAAQAQKRKWMEYSAPDNFLSQLLDHAAPDSHSKKVAQRPVILYIMDGDAMVLRNGASRVAHRQLRYLFKACYRVIGLFVATNFARSSRESSAWSEKLAAELWDYPFESVHVAMINPADHGGLTYRYLQNNDSLQNYSILRDLCLSRALTLPGELLAQLRKHPPSLVLMNYVTYIPVMEALDLAGTPLVCEVHDVQSFQKAIYEKRAISKEDISEEVALLSKCDYLISLSEVETSWIGEQVPKTPCKTLSILFDPLDFDESALYGYRDLAELVASCQPDEVTLQIPDDDYIQASPLQESLIRFGDRLDILYVSSAHQSNISGLKWFIDECFLPLLAPKGLTMVVAGTIKDACRWPVHPNLVFCGRVENLSPLYAATRTCVLPITEGAGSPIKTVEALAYGKPLVGTALAFRALPAQLRREVQCAETAPAMAKLILKLTGSVAARRATNIRLRKALRKLASTDDYSTTMDKIFSDTANLRPARSKEDGGLKRAAMPDAHVEWNAGIQWSNRVICAWLEPEAALIPAANWHSNPVNINSLRPVLEAIVKCDLMDVPKFRTLPLSARNYLAGRPKLAMESAVAIAISSQSDSRSAKGKLFSRELLLHGAGEYQVIVKVPKTGEYSDMQSSVGVSLDSRCLPCLKEEHFERYLLAYYLLPLRDKFPFFQKYLLTIKGEEVERIGVAISEYFGIRAILSSTRARSNFYNLESESGREFAWTAKPVAKFYVPTLRDITKHLVMNVHSFRKNTSEDCEISISGRVLRAAVGVTHANEGQIHCILEKCSGEFEACIPSVIALSTRHFERASNDDPRMVGVAITNVELVSHLLRA